MALAELVLGRECGRVLVSQPHVKAELIPRSLQCSEVWAAVKSTAGQAGCSGERNCTFQRGSCYLLLERQVSWKTLIIRQLYAEHFPDEHLKNATVYLGK